MVVSFERSRELALFKRAADGSRVKTLISPVLLECAFFHFRAARSILQLLFRGSSGTGACLEVRLVESGIFAQTAWGPLHLLRTPMEGKGHAPLATPRLRCKLPQRWRLRSGRRSFHSRRQEELPAVLCMGFLPAPEVPFLSLLEGGCAVSLGGLPSCGCVFAKPTACAV